MAHLMPEESRKWRFVVGPVEDPPQGLRFGAMITWTWEGRYILVGCGPWTWMIGWMFKGVW